MPSKPEVAAERLKQIDAEIRAFGAQVSKDNAISCADSFHEPRFEWYVRIALPFSYVSSKNAAYGYRSHRGGKTKYLKPEHKKYRDSIAFMLKNAVKPVKIKTHKVWIDIYVEKPNHYGDAVNVVDTVCDAVKLAIPIDDRWYSIRKLDWSINKVNPQLFVGIGQEIDVEDSKVCEACGLIKPLIDFGKDGLRKAGKCKSCRLRISDEELAKHPTRRTWR